MWENYSWCRFPTLARAVVVAATCLVSLSNTSNSAEFGASPYPKGFRDIYAGVVPTVPGLYVLNDVYHYDGSANALVFNGAAQLGVEAKFTADFLPLTPSAILRLISATRASRRLRSAGTAAISIGMPGYASLLQPANTTNATSPIPASITGRSSRPSPSPISMQRRIGKSRGPLPTP